MRVGYVRVSTTDQNLYLQLDALEKMENNKFEWKKTNPRRQTILIDENFSVGDVRQLPDNLCRVKAVFYEERF
jgi:uncharacterized protein YqcC (DUF446 family)